MDIDTLFLGVMVGLGLLCAALFGYAAWTYLRAALWHVADAITAIFLSIRASSARQASARERTARTEEFMEWLDTKLGEPSDTLNYEVLRARQKAPMLRRLVDVELPAAIVRCMRTHRLAACAARVDYLYEIALEPECVALRERVVNIADAAISKLEAYPLLVDDAALLQNLVVIRGRIVRTCRSCPYLEYRVDLAPVVCPSGIAARITPEMCESHAARP